MEDDEKNNTLVDSWFLRVYNIPELKSLFYKGRRYTKIKKLYYAHLDQLDENNANSLENITIDGVGPYSFTIWNANFSYIEQLYKNKS